MTDAPDLDPTDFAVARRADREPPYVVRVPVDGEAPLTFAVSAPWPTQARLRCRPVESWPPRAELVDRCAVAAVVRRGPCLDVVLERGADNRCQFLLSPVELDDSGSAATDEEAVFWQTATTVTVAAPRQRVPTARERGVETLHVLVDTREQRPWAFEDHPVTTERRTLRAGDYAVLHDGGVLAAVERKKTSDFAKSLMRGRMPAQLAALDVLPRAAVVVESSYANVLNSRRRITRSRMADLIGSVQAAYPAVPLVFAGSRGSAQEWTFHWLAACLSHRLDELAPSPLDPA